MKSKTKKILIACLAVAVLVSAGAGAYICFSGDEKIGPVKTVKLFDTAEPPIQLVARGGLGAQTPENTMVAFEAAGRAGFTMVEIPVHRTLDGVWVVMRDNTVNRMTDGRGKIKKYTYYDLLNFNIDNGANIEKFDNIKIPTLEQVLDLCANYAMRTVIDIEEGSEDNAGSLAQIIKERDIAEMCAVSSSDMDLLLEMKKLCPKAEFWYTADKLTDEELAVCMKNKDITVDFNANQKKNTDEAIKKLVAAGLKTACWTVDDTEVLERMHVLGVRTILTNCIVPR